MRESEEWSGFSTVRRGRTAENCNGKKKYGKEIDVIQGDGLTRTSEGFVRNPLRARRHGTWKC